MISHRCYVVAEAPSDAFPGDLYEHRQRERTQRGGVLRKSPKKRPPATTRTPRQLTLRAVVGPHRAHLHLLDAKSFVKG